MFDVFFTYLWPAIDVCLVEQAASDVMKRVNHEYIRVFDSSA
jgi:hypothetical protein